MGSFFRYLIKDKVFIIAFLFACISMFFVLPNKSYLGYINYRVLVIMFTIMIAVAGIYETKFFDFIATELVMRFKNIKYIALVIILTTFFLSMFLTNDAVLLTLIPFTIFITKHTHTEKHAVSIIMIQTIAANMGSALTPMGDPQNIYLYTYYSIGFKEFLFVTMPITIMGFVLVTLTTFVLIPHVKCDLNLKAPRIDIKHLFFYMFILINALLSVLHVIPVFYTFIITILLIIFFGKHLVKRVDYLLLLTFVSFFIFTGNISHISWIKNHIEGLFNDKITVFFSGLITSQFISNVPAAVLLSTFVKPDFWKPLLQSVNIGAMGTIIASLASLITFKYVIREFPGSAKIYLLKYSVVSFIFISFISAFILVFF